MNKRKAELSEGIRADQKDVLTLMLTASDPQYVHCVVFAYRLSDPIYRLIE